MLLVIDIGNTNIVLGVFRDDELTYNWRLQTVHGRTADEHTLLLRQLFEASGIVREDIEDSVISSVVPGLTATMEQTCSGLLGRAPIVVGPGVKTGIEIKYENPREVGADRIVNAVAAFSRFQTAGVIVDFGTATTFDAIGYRGEYLGGAISPGIGISSEALFSKASKLPRVRIGKPPHVIGRTTEKSMQSGLFFGYVGLVDGIVERMLTELPSPHFVIATGGLAPLFVETSETLQVVDEELTLHGLKLIHTRNRRG